MEITDRIIAYVEKQKWDEDAKQDLYVQILENDEPVDTPSKSLAQLQLELRTRYWNLLRNAMFVERNRKRILDERAGTIRSVLGLKGESPDPADVLEAQSEIEGKLRDLSPLLRATLEQVVLGDSSVEEFAESEGISPNTVYQRVWEAKKQIGESNE